MCLDIVEKNIKKIVWVVNCEHTELCDLNGMVKCGKNGV